MKIEQVLDIVKLKYPSSYIQFFKTVILKEKKEVKKRKYND